MTLITELCKAAGGAIDIPPLATVWRWHPRRRTRATPANCHAKAGR
ncbi:MAG: hypothetical protein J6X49_18530 [Victivallales bacterium]|nr:hypothetical protein [Victivallales bacterium]